MQRLRIQTRTAHYVLSEGRLQRSETKITSGVALDDKLNSAVTEIANAVEQYDRLTVNFPNGLSEPNP